jgi:hypothetical protein
MKETQSRVGTPGIGNIEIEGMGTRAA